MKAVIFNSGRGVRMGALTAERPKCMVPLYNGETIFERQIRILGNCGIREFVITTGPHKEQLVEETRKFPEFTFTFVENPDYTNTNYIVSMHLAKEHLQEELLLLHGDLVFNERLVYKILGDEKENLCLFNPKKELPEKDFKGRFRDNVLREVSVSIFAKDCYAFQPFYKLNAETVAGWMKQVEQFVEAGKTTVYAEDALNTVLDTVTIQGLSYEQDYIEEIDTEEDYKKVSEQIQEWDEPKQQIISTHSYADALRELLPKEEPVFVVCSKRERERVEEALKGCSVTFFHDYSPNPKYEEIVDGVALFRRGEYQIVVALGGGSAMDVAKCIKLFRDASEEGFLQNKFEGNDVSLIAIPTTAGTGSESTAIAVIYYHGEKHSVTHESILPKVAILDAGFLASLPEYHRKSAMADALCQAIESYWSLGATSESQYYAKRCIKLISEYAESYLKGDTESAAKILEAANFSGKAIHISRTTAAHAMSYKLTTRYGISHGHAVAVCLLYCWAKVYECIHKKPALRTRLYHLAKAMGYDSIKDSILGYERFYRSLGLTLPEIPKEDLEMLVSSVNVERLGNHPMKLTKEDLYKMYTEIRLNG